MPQTKRRRTRKPSTLSHACRVEALEDRRLLAAFQLNNEYDHLEWTHDPVAIAPNLTLQSTAQNELVYAVNIFRQFNDGYVDVDIPEGSNIYTRVDEITGCVLQLLGYDTPENYEAIIRTLTWTSLSPIRAGHPSETIHLQIYGAGQFGNNPFNFHEYIPLVTPFLTINNAISTKSQFADEDVEMTFTVTLELPSVHDVTVQWSTLDDTATAGSDYEAAGGTLTFSPGGETSQEVTVIVPGKRAGALALEPDEDFFVRLSNPVNALFGSLAPPTLTSAEYLDVRGRVQDSFLSYSIPDELDDIVTTSHRGSVTTRISTDTGEIRLEWTPITGPLSQTASLAISPTAHAGSAVVEFDVIAPATIFGTTVQFKMAAIEPSGGVGAFTTYSSSDGIPAGTSMHFAFPVKPQSLSTGTYTWTALVGFFYSPTSSYQTPNSKASYHGLVSIVNRTPRDPQDPPPVHRYAQGTWLNGLDELAIQERKYRAMSPTSFEPMDRVPQLAQPAGITYTAGDGTSIFFAYNSITQEYVTPAGYFVTLSREGDEYVLRNPQRLEKRFSLAGQLTTVLHADGYAIAYNYNSDGTVSVISDSDDYSISFTYDAGRLNTITDAAGRVTERLSQASPLSLTSPPESPGGLRQEVSLTDSTNYMTLSVAPLSSQGESVQFQPYGRFGGTATTFVDSPEGRYIITPSMHERLGGSAFPKLLRRSSDSSSATILHGVGSLSTASIRFNSDGFVDRATDYRGHVTSYDRYGTGLVKSITLPGDATPQYVFTYDEVGNMLTHTSKATTGIGGQPDALESWEYDSVWNVPTSYTDPYDNTTIYGINPNNGQVQSVHQQVVEEPNGEPTADLLTYFYYTAGGSGIPAGLISRVVGPNLVNGQLVETRYEYTLEGDHFVHKVTEAHGTPRAIERKYVYERDTMTLRQIVDERGKATDFTYNDWDLLERIEEPAPEDGLPRPVWEYAYTRAGYVHTIKNPNQETTTYQYWFGLGGYRDVSVAPSAASPTWSYKYAMGRLDRAFEPGGTTAPPAAS